MSYRFNLQLTRVECRSEAIGEWGKDEMRVLGFGVTRKGQFFTVAFRSLGSYSTGDVNKSSTIPQTWFEGVLPDDGLEVLLYFWLVEEDSGGVSDSASSLQAEMEQLYRDRVADLLANKFPRDCIPFAAFYRATGAFQTSLQSASEDGINNDELYFPADRVITYEGVNANESHGTLHFERSKNAGHYALDFTFHYQRDLVVIS